MGLYDIALLFDSADRPEERVRRALELLGRIVPYDQCALLEARLGCDPRIVLAAPLPPDERSELTAALAELFGKLVDPDRADADASSPPAAPQLAVPLVGLDSVIGLLLVRRARGEYTADDVRSLSVVAAQLAAYLTMVRARGEAAEQRRQLDDARRAVDDARRARDEFLALAAHELEAPLRAMLDSVRALGGRDADAAQRQLALQALEREVQAQRRLIGDVVALSAVSTAALRLDLRVSEPAALVKATIDGLRLEAERRSIRLDADLDETVMPLAMDADRIGQVLSTLVRNALRVTPAGGHVEVRLDNRMVGYVRFQVADSGCGIGAEELPRIFDRPHGRGGGDLQLGVGLALVKRLVELHRGRVRAESAGAQRGATFTVELPRRALGTRPLPTVGDGPLAGVRVLLVDHDPGLGDAFRAALDHHGAEVTVAGSSSAALAALASARPDVVLFGDLAMPRAAIYELMREVAVRSSPLPAASITAYDRPEEAARARAAGCRTLVGKPLEIGALVDLVARLAGRTTEPVTATT